MQSTTKKPKIIQVLLTEAEVGALFKIFSEALALKDLGLANDVVVLYHKINAAPEFNPEIKKGAENE